MNWPDKLYLQREGGGTISGYWQPLPLNANDAKYVLSEILASREIEIIHATLKAAEKYCAVFDLDLSGINPLTILNNMDKK